MEGLVLLGWVCGLAFWMTLPGSPPKMNKGAGKEVCTDFNPWAIK